MSQPQGQLRGPTFSENIYATAYSDAVVKAIGSADTAVTAVVTASFSLATAYGALVGLVAPKDDPGDVILGLPFFGFALAVLVALWAGAGGVSVQVSDDVPTVRSAITSTVNSKRGTTRGAIVILFLSVMAAAYVVVTAYAAPATEEENETASVILTSEGATSLEAQCPDTGSTGTVSGTVSASSLDQNYLVIAPDEGTCNVTKLKIAKELVVAVSYI